MSNEITPFERIRRESPAGNEFWSSRDFAQVLGYADYRNFDAVVEKARTACFNSGQRVDDHFVEITEMVGIGSGAQRPVKTVMMSRYACYLVIQNADPVKEIVALGQTYFAVKDYAIFQNHGYAGLYGGLVAQDIHARKGLKKGQQILDHMGSTELAANLFRATQAEEKLRGAANHQGAGRDHAGASACGRERQASRVQNQNTGIEEGEKGVKQTAWPRSLRFGEIGPHVTPRLSEPIRWSIGARLAGIHQRPRIARVRLRAPGPIGIHRHVVRVGSSRCGGR